jgi:tetratricopeptide (TPR) repeat protein
VDGAVISAEPTVVGDAEDLLALATSRPAEALPAARELLRRRRDPRTRTYCHHAIGIVLREQEDLPGSLRALRLGLALAERHGLHDRAADIGGTLGTVLMLHGRPSESRRAFDLALSRARGLEAAKVRMRRGGVLTSVAGRHDEALADLQAALRVFRRHNDLVWEARTVANMAWAEWASGRYDRAEASLARSEEIERALDQPYGAAVSRANRAEVARLRGDLPAALGHLDVADELYREAGVPAQAVAIADRGHVLLEAGLHADALSCLERAGALLGGGASPSVTWAEIALHTAEVALAVGDTRLCTERTRQARKVFERLAHRERAARARLLELQARRAAPVDRHRVARDAAALAATSDLLWPDAVEASLLAGRAALALGDVETGRTHLAAAARARTRGTPLTRSRGWLAAALRAEAAGRRTAVLTACERGLDVLDEHRLTLGATELRAAATAHGTELADLGLRHALADGDPRLLLMWSERWRATTLAIPPVRPPDDRELAAELTALRDVVRRIEEAAADGSPTTVLERERRRLEEAARARTLRTRGEGSATLARTDPEELVASLGGATLVEMVAVDGRLQVLVADAHGVRRHAAGDLGEAAREVDHARFALHRLSRPSTHGRAAAVLARSAAATLEATAVNLERLLLGGAAEDLAGDGPLVVVPPGSLHAVPWGLLPALRGRAVSVAPSAAVWLRGRKRRRPADARVALIAGPDLGTGGGELPALAEGYPQATVLSDGAATAEAVLTALDGAWLAHVAAHGEFRADNPMFSALRMDDGPLTVHDLCRLRRAPYLLLLSSCESGLAAPTGADELLGLTSALVPLGTVGVLASVVPVNDEATVTLMVTVHDRLRDGASLAEALRAARDAAGVDPVAQATAAAFVALGSA